MFNNNLKFYAVYSHPNKGSPLKQAEFVPQGICIPAFFSTINFLWALYHRMWLVAAVILGLTILTTNLKNHGTITIADMVIIQFCFNIFLAFSGYDLWERTLRRRGYQLIDVATGYNIASARQRFYDRHTQEELEHAVAPPSSPSKQQQLSLQFA